MTESVLNDLRTSSELLAELRRLSAEVEALRKRSTGWVAPKDRYAVPVLFNPYTGEPRDVRDVQSDPQGILIVPSGKVEMLAATPRHPARLWMWRNFVDGKPEYWAFDNPFPVYTDCDDPQTLGEPCGYALFKESRNGRPDVSDEEVMRRVMAARPGGEG